VQRATTGLAVGEPAGVPATQPPVGATLAKLQPPACQQSHPAGLERLRTIARSPTLVQTRTPTISHAPIATAPRVGPSNPAATTSRKTDSTAAGRSTATPTRRFPTLLPHLEPATTCARRRWRRRAAPTVHPCARCSPPRRPSSPTGSTCHPAPGSGRADQILHRDPDSPARRKFAGQCRAQGPSGAYRIDGAYAAAPPPHSQGRSSQGSSPRPAIPRPGGRGIGTTAPSATVKRAWRVTRTHHPSRR